MMRKARYVTALAAVALPLALLTVTDGCKNKEDDTPVASTPPPPPPPPTQPAVLTPEEDAGAPVDAGVDAAKPTGTGSFATITKCCNALRSNMASAPPEQKGYYAAAAAACDGMKNTPSAQQAFGQIRQFLAGAKMPGACQ